MELEGCIDSKFLDELPIPVRSTLDQLALKINGTLSRSNTAYEDTPGLRAEYDQANNRVFFNGYQCRLNVSGFDKIDYSKFSVEYLNGPLKILDMESNLEILFQGMNYQGKAKPIFSTPLDIQQQ